MTKVLVEADIFSDWEKFHDFFYQTFEFPVYYGRNMDAWNDCMSDYCYSNGLVSLHVDNSSGLKLKGYESFNALIECSAFINWRSTNDGGEPLIVLSYYV